MLGVYLDVCCLNRPFNDQTQDRIRLESAAVLSVLRRIEQNEWLGIISTAVEAEIEKDSDLARKAEIRKLAALAKRIVVVEQKEAVRAIHLQTFGFGAFDALHVACAESAEADVLLTVDDRFLRLATRLRGILTVRVANPATWLLEILQND